MQQFPIKIFVYTFTYNNADILPFIIDYWKQYATKVIVYDCGSTDSTCNILKNYDWIELRTNIIKNFNLQNIIQIKNQCTLEAKHTIADYIMICNINEVIYCYEDLFKNLEYYNSKNVNIFEISYYETMCDTFPIYNGKNLLQNFNTIKAVKNEKIHNIIVFKPNINIIFTNDLLNNANIINNDKIIKTKLKILHLIFNLTYFQNNYKKYIDNSDNTIKLPYGKNINNLIQIYNYLYTLPFENNKLELKFKKINNNVICNKNINNYYDFINNCKGTIYNSNNLIQNKNIVITIPIYKQILNEQELNSLKQLLNIVKNKYNIFLICPEKLYIQHFNNILNYKFNYVVFNNEYFQSLTTYSYLCETLQFYEIFKDYKYMFLYQLDGWIFSDNFDYFIEQNYDYYGSPWKAGNFEFSNDSVGNGGVSLRKISKFIEICKNINKHDITSKWLYSEDLFFCKTIKEKEGNNFNIAPSEIAMQFSIDGNYEYWYKKNNYKLPMCTHKYTEKKIFFSNINNNNLIISSLQNDIDSLQTDIMSNKKIVISASHGRLGNLLFEIAAGKYYADKIGASYYLLNNSNYNNYILYYFKNNMSFLKDINIIDDKYFNQIKEKFITYNEQCLYDEIPYSKNNYIFIEGYRESPKYWNNDKQFIFNLFNEKTSLLLKIKQIYNINFNEYVSINIRRGDYLRKDVINRLGLLDIKWFKKCMSNYSDKQKYLIISDDIEWCKSTFIGDNFLFADKNIENYNKVFIDFWIQTLCKDNIISNSTFSWWAAYLNKNKNRKVYCPKQFFKLQKGTSKIPENDNWILVNTIWANAQDIKYTKADKYENFPSEKYICNDKVVYTCITGDYDDLKEPEYISNGFDYICFTDNPQNLNCKIWKILPIPDEYKNLSSAKINRAIKINAHKFLANYNLSIYIDGNIELKDDLNTYLNTILDENVIYIPKHPTRDCIYDEVYACASAKKDTLENMQKQVCKYAKEGFPKHFGLTQNNIIIRYHNTKNCIALMNEWWNQVLNNSYRDQLSLFYCIWKTKIKIKILDKKLYNTKYFYWCGKHIQTIHKNILKYEDVKQFNMQYKNKMKGGYQENPITIQDKLRWLNINDIPWSEKYNIPLKSVCADKILVKEYVKDILGIDIAVPCIKIYKNTNEINWNELPKQFIIKVNHNSGGTIICKNLQLFNKQYTIEKINQWLNVDFAFKNGFESHYHWIDRKILVEEYLYDENQKDSLFDYKFWCFNGEPKLYTINDGHGHGDILYYNTYNDSIVDLYGILDKNKSLLKKYNKPKNFDKMIEYAKKLALPFKFVRIDFYEVNNKVYLGEMTFVPGAAMFKYKNDNDNKKIGDLLQL